MTITACGDEYTEEDKKALDEAAKGYDSKMTQEVWGKFLEEHMPEVERAIEERIIECLQENVENGRNELIENLNKEGREPTDIERLDLGVEPTQEEYQEMFKVGKELGMTSDLEIIDMPVITGIKDPAEVLTQEEIQSKIQIGEIKLGEIEQVISQIEQKVRENHVDIDIMKSLMKETLSFLKNSKIPSEWRDQATINMIVFVDRPEPGTRPGYIATEKVPAPELLQMDPGRSRNLYMFQNKEGRLLPANEAERKDFYWRLAHGICHINDVKWGKVDERVLTPDGVAAFKAQLKTGPVSDYAREAIESCKGDFDKILGHPELRAELYAAWVMDSPKLCPEMKEFFDNNFSE